MHVEGGVNFIYLLGVVLSAMLSSFFSPTRIIRDLTIVAMALLSWFTTPRKIHHANHFHFHPFLEIAALFLGIFISVVPVLAILNERAASLNLTEPWEYFWLTGILSSILDSAPAYLTFGAMASGLSGGTLDNLKTLLQSNTGERLLAAISCGAVFMGAGTYIGNAPNFMVKAIAERSGIRMPSFAAYVVYSAAVLLPLFVAVSAVFFR
jgi:Na+/H+ antiporter NhaD/arsenite permease-like protein